MTLKLGMMTGYWGAKPPADLIGTAQQAEKLGYWGFFTAEAYGSDAFTPLAWVGSHTEKIKLGTAIVQMSARTPTSTAMHTLTLDHRKLWKAGMDARLQNRWRAHANISTSSSRF